MLGFPPNTFPALFVKAAMMREGFDNKDKPSAVSLRIVSE